MLGKLYVPMSAFTVTFVFVQHLIGGARPNCFEKQVNVHSAYAVCNPRVVKRFFLVCRGILRWLLRQEKRDEQMVDNSRRTELSYAGKKKLKNKK